MESLLWIFCAWIVADVANAFAFCNGEKDERQSNFPLDQPERHIPWVWEAVHDKTRNLVEVTSIPLKSCYFNQTIWGDLLRLFPAYSSQLGDGLHSNILVHVDHPRLFDYTGSQHPHQGLLNKVILCQFMRGNTIVVTSMSLKIIGEPVMTSISTLHIRCPVPPGLQDQSWNRIQLVRNDDYVKSKSSSPMVKMDGVASVPVPVCKDFQSTIDSQDERANGGMYAPPLPRKPKYGLSVCSATARVDAAHLIEWLEYHILLGVDHFFLYDTALPRSRQGQLARVLHEYVKEGLVTIVSWPYENCVRRMASGRGMWWIPPNKTWSGTFDYFQPPRAIAQTAALASCYSRFRTSSEYIAHIDDDEFFNINTNANVHSDPKWNMIVRSLYRMAKTIFERNPAAVALRLAPVDKYHCLTLPDNRDPNKRFHTELPRLGKWRHGFLGDPANGKMIMRTDRVVMFFVHYVTVVEDGWKTDDVVRISRTYASTLHYKVRVCVCVCVYVVGSEFPSIHPDNVNLFVICACSCACRCALHLSVPH